MSLILSGTDGLSDVDGSAATPAIRGTDANTGIFFPAADTIAFAEGGVEAMRVNANGQVGIGLTSYNLPLSIAADANGQNIQINGRTGDDFGQIFFRNFGGANNLARIASDSNAGLVFGTGSQTAPTVPTERMRIDSSGNVGIGTASPAYRLHSYGGAVTNPTNFFSQGYIANGAADTRCGTIRNAFDSNASFGTYWTAFRGANGTSYQARFGVTTSGTDFDVMTLDSSGRVLIGTATPNTDVKTLIKASSNTELQIQLEQSNVTDGYGLRCSSSDGDLTFNRYQSSAYTERMRLTVGGNLTISGATATKASGTTWANPSDQRLKNNIRDYDKGTAELMQVRVREWVYNGKGGTTDGMKGLGVIADEVMTVLPNTVENYNAKLNADDEETTAIKKFDATEITWLLVKTVQEQQALITALTARITALETP